MSEIHYKKSFSIGRMAKRIQAIVGSTSLAAAAIAGYVYAIRWRFNFFLISLKSIPVKRTRQLAILWTRLG